MRIKKLKISNKNYKNLDINIENNTSGIMAFIGNNGSGKSNLLEAISIIFKYFYEKKEKDVPFDFSLTYTIGGKNEIEITKKKTSVITKIDGNQRSDPYDHLPQQIVAIYSGEEDRLWQKCYKAFHKQYIIDTNNKNMQSEIPKMLYIDKFYWNISLLCLLLNRFYNENDTFCDNILGVKNVHSVKFNFNKNNYQGYADSLAKQFVTKIDQKDEYTLEELKEIIDNEGYTIIDVYKYLYVTSIPYNNKKMIENIVIKYNDENLELEDFSEGEKKMLLIKSALEFAGQEDSLFILDEPDAHIHLANKIQIRKVFEPYEDHRQIVITTHSPTLTKYLSKESVFCLEKGKLKELGNMAEITKYLANKEDIYNLLFSKSDILIVEGKTDDKYIKRAIHFYKEEYPNLNFQILRVGGTDEENIQNLIENIDLKENQQIIILVDRDKAGKYVHNNIFGGNKGIEDILYEKYSNRDSVHFLMLPHKAGTNQYNFLIEDYFDKSLIKKLSEDYIQREFIDKNAVSFGSFPKIKEKIKSELLLNFCESERCKKEDMEDFKVLLDKLNEIVDVNSFVSQPQNYIEIITDARASDVSAWFFPDDEKVILKKGSKLPKNEVESYDKKQKENRQKELKKIAKTEKEFYILEQDKEFSSVSTALNFALGRSSNGWKVWRIKNNGEILGTIRNK